MALCFAMMAIWIVRCVAGRVRCVDFLVACLIFLTRPLPALLCSLNVRRNRNGERGQCGRPGQLAEYQLLARSVY